MVTRTLGRAPLSWPFKVVGYLVLAIVVLVLLAGAVVSGAVVYYELTRTTAGDLDGMIEAELHSESSTDQVVRFLDSQGIEHGAVVPVDVGDPRLKDASVPEGATTVSGIIRNDGYALEHVDVRFTMIMEADGTLEDWVVWEVKR